MINNFRHLKLNLDVISTDNLSSPQWFYFFCSRNRQFATPLKWTVTPRGKKFLLSSQWAAEVKLGSRLYHGSAGESGVQSFESFDHCKGKNSRDMNLGLLNRIRELQWLSDMNTYPLFRNPSFKSSVSVTACHSLPPALPLFSVTRAYCKELLRDTFSTHLLPDTPTGSHDPSSNSARYVFKDVLNLAKEANSSLVCHGNIRSLATDAHDSGMCDWGMCSNLEMRPY